MGPGRRSLDEEYRRMWGYQTGPNGTWSVFSQFPPFPNPHIRSNGFLISRKRFLDLAIADIKTKYDACIFESGINSMTAQIRRQGLKAVVVGRSGEGFSIRPIGLRARLLGWGPKAICSLPTIRAVNLTSWLRESRATHARMTWGDYLAPAPSDFPDVGLSFAVEKAVVGGGPELDPGAVKFSFVIPTKNRLEILKHAVDSILRQPYANFELIVSDNASEQGYEEYINGLDDSRISYQRLTEPVSVTENWNRALARATGEYVLMLGDDDALTPWFASEVQSILRNHAHPDVLYFPAYHYCYPNVNPLQPSGYLVDVHNSVFLENQRTPFCFRVPLRGVLPKLFLISEAFTDSTARVSYSRLSFCTSSRTGGVFQSRYPDTFAAVVSFIRAKSILVVPNSMVIIGISPKSFGYYYFNDLQTKGYEFLDNGQVSADIRRSLKDIVLEGDNNNTCWMIAAERATRCSFLNLINR